MTLGQKIKARRKQCKLTQAELAKEQITRNMLSQIEADKAQPSLSTLCYLAKELSLPVGYFFCNEDEEIVFQKQELMPKLHSLFRGEEWQECLSFYEKSGVACDDEIGYMMALCAFRIGEGAFHNGSMDTAVSSFDTCAAYAKKTVYPTEWILAGCQLMRAIAQNVQSPLLEFDEDVYTALLRKAGNLDLYSYLTEKIDHPYQNRFYVTHLKARRLLRSSHYQEALSALLSLESEKAAREMNAYMLFHVYGDIEICCRELGDYEGAYRYSAKRVSLLNAFHS